MATLRDKLEQTLRFRGLAAETPDGNQRKAFKETAEYIEALESRVKTLEKQLKASEYLISRLRIYRTSDDDAGLG